MPDLPPPSARKHYRRDHLDDDALHYAASHVLRWLPLDDEDDPRRWLMIAVDPSGRLLELITLIYDDGYELIIHAMKARSQYLDGLQQSSSSPPANVRDLPAPPLR